MKSQEKKFESEYLLSNEEIKKLGIDEFQAEIFRRKYYQDSFAIDSWYDKLSEYTFRSIEIELLFEEAEELIVCYNKYIMSKKKTTEGMEFNKLKKLMERIDGKLNLFKFGAFIKLNTRSPKDVPQYEFETEKSKKIIDNEIQKMMKIDDKMELNSIGHALIIATNKMMKIENSRDAIELLIKSSRVYEDLSKNISFGKEHYQSKLILREWIPEVVDHPEMEFRCFVHEKNLHAVSQYFCDTVFPNLLNQKEEIKKRLIKFYEEVVKDLVPHKSFVVDFFVGKDKVYIIELNPFHIGAGACLFSWQHDRHIFFNGPLEFRFNETKGDIAVGSIQMEKYLIKTYQFFQIPQHEKFKAELKKTKDAEGYEFIIVFFMLTTILGVLNYFSKINK
eukprot:gene3788-6949_t